MVSGVSPFHQPGAGRLTSTVSWPGLAGVIEASPFFPVSSQLPILSAAEAGAAAASARVAAATRVASKAEDRGIVSRLLTDGRAAAWWHRAAPPASPNLGNDQAPCPANASVAAIRRRRM